MTRELQSTLEASGIEWLVLMNYIPCMECVIKLGLGVFMISLGAKGPTKSWEAHESDHQFGTNESINIGKSQRLCTEGNARLNMLSDLRPGLAMIFEKVQISRYIEIPQTELHKAWNVTWVEYTDTWS